MIDSSIASGAGSVAVRALQAFPTTFSTSGISDMILFVSMSKSLALLSLTSGTVIGIYMILPSSRGGMNSLPIRVNKIHHTASITSEITSDAFLNFKAANKTGLYIIWKNRTKGIS